nr:hypothetical protein [Angustibacter aerolatus]
MDHPQGRARAGGVAARLRPPRVHRGARPAGAGRRACGRWARCGSRAARWSPRGRSRPTST